MAATASHHTLLLIIFLFLCLGEVSVCGPAILLLHGVSPPIAVVVGGPYNLPRRTWSTLNRIRTSTGRCNYLLNKWNMSPDQNCDCGQIQTMHHILRDCPRRFFQGTLGDIHRCTEEALEWIPRRRENKSTYLEGIFKGVGEVVLAAAPLGEENEMLIEEDVALAGFEPQFPDPVFLLLLQPYVEATLEEQLAVDNFHHKPTKSTIAAFIDLSQAFDRVWKEKQILKLDELGIEGSMLSWISNFLSKRTIQVNFNNIKSKTTRIYQGLPQGSILSPILFNIYLNDIHTFIKPPAKIALYADDIIIWVSKNNLSEAEQSLNKAMKDSPRYLGVTLDPALTFKKHIDTMISKAKNRLKILKKISGLNWGANANILRTTYLALVRPILEYATPAWINASKTNLSKIDRIQASAAKIISGLRGSCPNHIAELESNLLPLHLRRKICFSKFITKILTLQKNILQENLLEIGSQTKD
ncbi:hypothetical protein LAZ67_22001713 [Cordylochernes scorpioides]|uniref:Reverse transcriptase domain-containing protein n=1 Tax=Cordylochernes scorpioides TaxID=51811 RepID=A0ABY6LQ74_9ARAC|nr:hypothetical protein LAZ67_22001713 [Cordylochernes scorpioides]